MLGVAAPELVLILIIALVVFGPGKLPEIGRAVGRSIGEFKATQGGKPVAKQQGVDKS